VIQINSEDRIIDLLEFLLKEAFRLNASDIHIDPTKDFIRIRLRIDGTLKEVPSLPKNKHQELISRIKILSSLRIDEHFKAQDGRFRLSFEDEKFLDVRVSILPTYHGENAVLRLLSDRNESLSISKLGFSTTVLDKIKNSFQKTSGMILSTGPTGSGKTTTLYSIIKELNKPEISIVTLEDPVEYAIPGIRQVQVDKQGSLSFVNGLRSILRQDPNIIMVGEIRDKETANMAVNTALTGHLLLSTLHTNDAAATLPRLLDMGVEPFLLASTFSAAINQRLVKKICSQCIDQENLNDFEIRRLSNLLKIDVRSLQLFKGKGCDECQGEGFKGRTVINESLLTSERIRQLILEKKPAGEIRKVAIEEGMATLVQDGLEKAEKGITTIDEILRVANE